MRTRSFAVAVFPIVACWLAAQACTCGKPANQSDAGCGDDTCQACPEGCTSANACESGAWTCSCTCTVTSETFCQTLAEKECDFDIRCHSEPSLVGPDPSEGRGTPPFGYQDQVASSERTRCEALLSNSATCRQAQASFAAGRSKFDAVAFSACIAAAYPGDTCARDFNQVQDLCLKTGFALPLSSAGALCQADQECTNGFCDATSGCGTCQPYVAVNGACTRSAQCDPAVSYCAIPTGQTSGTCLAFKVQGDTCNPYSLSGQVACGQGRVCALQGGFIPTGSCQPGVQQGQACVMDRYQCQRSGRALPELVCAHDAAANQDTCVPLQSGPGGPCGTGELVVPSATTGGTRGPVCRETEYCLSNVCTPRKAVLSPCTTDEECVAGTRCVATADGGTELQCEPYADLAQTCAQDSECKNLLGCDAGSCVGEYALTGESCDPARCASGACDAGTCVGLQPTGASCTSGADCASDVCTGTCSAACWQ